MKENYEQSEVITLLNNQKVETLNKVKKIIGEEIRDQIVLMRHYHKTKRFDVETRKQESIYSLYRIYNSFMDKRMSLTELFSPQVPRLGRPRCALMLRLLRL